MDNTVKTAPVGDSIGYTIYQMADPDGSKLVNPLVVDACKDIASQIFDAIDGETDQREVDELVGTICDEVGYEYGIFIDEGFYIKAGMEYDDIFAEIEPYSRVDDYDKLLGIDTRHQISPRGVFDLENGQKIYFNSKIDDKTGHGFVSVGYSQDEVNKALEQTIDIHDIMNECIHEINSMKPEEFVDKYLDEEAIKAIDLDETDIPFTYKGIEFNMEVGETGGCRLGCSDEKYAPYGI